MYGVITLPILEEYRSCITEWPLRAILYTAYIIFRTDRKCCISLPSHQRSLLTWDRDWHVGSHWTQHKDKMWICNCEYISFPHIKSCLLLVHVHVLPHDLSCLLKKKITLNASMLPNYFEQHCTCMKKICSLYVKSNE